MITFTLERCVKMLNVNLELVARDAQKAVARNDVIIIIDVLRCTSSIITALTNKAHAIVPVQTVSEARSTAKKNARYLLAGERGGIKPAGFSLGNSPLEFTRDRVVGKTIIMTTTSGTSAFARVKGHPWVLVGAFLNAAAIAQAAIYLSQRNHTNVSFVLSGKRGAFSLEDFLGAGAIIHHFTNRDLAYSDSAYASLLAFEQVQQSLFAALCEGTHARMLLNLGFEDDVRHCSQINKYTTVPILCGESIIIS
jgi:2-phosphosulfolactate phosphatase